MLALVACVWYVQRVCPTAIVVCAGPSYLTVLPLLRANETSDLLSLALSQPRKEAARMVSPSLLALWRQLEKGAVPRMLPNTSGTQKWETIWGKTTPVTFEYLVWFYTRVFQILHIIKILLRLGLSVMAMNQGNSASQHGNPLVLLMSFSCVA